MNIVLITSELNKCLKYSNTESDLVNCLDHAFEKCEAEKNSVMTLLPKEDALFIKKILVRMLNEKKLSVHHVFKKLWWNKNKEYNVIAAYFIYDVFNNPTEIDWIFFRQVLDRLKSWDLTTIVSSVFEEVIIGNIENWQLYINEIIKLNNKWAQRLAALIIGKIALEHADQTPALLEIIVLLQRNRDWEVQEAVNWCLNIIAGVAKEPLKIERLNNIDLSKVFSLN